jgi:hypothetical protein
MLSYLGTAVLHEVRETFAWSEHGQRVSGLLALEAAGDLVG